MEKCGKEMANLREQKISKLEKAYSVFRNLTQQAREGGCENIDMPIPADFDIDNFVVVTEAIQELSEIGEQRLLELEKQNVIPNVTRGVLNSARYSVKLYQRGDREFDRDRYEQLMRVCSTVKTLYQEGIL